MSALYEGTAPQEKGKKGEREEKRAPNRERERERERKNEEGKRKKWGKGMKKKNTGIFIQ